MIFADTSIIKMKFNNWSRFWAGVGALFTWGTLQPQYEMRFRKLQEVHKNKFIGPAIAFSFSASAASVLYLFSEKQSTQVSHWILCYPIFLCLAFFTVYGPHYFRTSSSSTLSLFRFLCHLTITSTATLISTPSELQSLSLLGAYGLLLFGYMTAGLLGRLRFSFKPLLSKLPVNLRNRIYEFYDHLLNNQLSRRLMYFLILNVILTIVEFWAGFTTNSLTMISEACHMGFDCVSLFVGFVSLLVSRKTPTRIYTFGFSRLTVIAGFVNAIFLLFTGTHLVFESIERFFNTPEVQMSGWLIYLPVFSVAVNLLGALLLQEQHHGHSQCDHNLRAMYLHCVTDCLGSLSLLLSVISIQKFGFHWIDPLCSMFIVALIFYSVVPLLFQTAGILLLKTPERLLQIEKVFQQVLSDHASILAYRDLHVWQLTSKETIGSVYLKVSNFESAQPGVTKLMRTLKASMKFEEFIIQMETEADGVKSLNYRYNTL